MVLLILSMWLWLTKSDQIVMIYDVKLFFAFKTLATLILNPILS